MPVTVSGTSITFNDATVQTTAASAASTAFGGIGSYALLANAANADVATGGTVAGSSLRYDYGAPNSIASSSQSPYQTAFVYEGGGSYSAGGSAVSGTWRKVSTGNVYRTYFNACVGTVRIYHVALFVRIS